LLYLHRILYDSSSTHPKLFSWLCTTAADGIVDSRPLV
jgi:hypothetical protein